MSTPATPGDPLLCTDPHEWEYLNVGGMPWRACLNCPFWEPVPEAENRGITVTFQ